MAGAATAMSYGTEMMTLTIKSIKNLCTSTTQHAIKRAMLGISLREHINNNIM